MSFIRFTLSLALILWTVCAEAQDLGNDSYEEQEELWTDSLLFYRPIQTMDDLYAPMLSFNLPRVKYQRRGIAFYDVPTYVDGLRMEATQRSILSLMGGVKSGSVGLRDMENRMVGEGGMRQMKFIHGEPIRPFSVAVNYSDERYRVRTRLKWEHLGRKGWHMILAGDYRTGRDAHIRGVFTHSLTLAGRFTKMFKCGEQLTFWLILPPKMEGAHRSATEEAFTLTNTVYYNPQWGLQSGKERSSDVKRNVEPYLGVSFRGRISPLTHFEATFSALLGIRKRSGLGWYHAQTPMPDDYRKMPSYTHDAENLKAWQEANPLITQVQWDELIFRNRMHGSEAIYTLEDKVTRHLNLRTELRFTTQINSHTHLHYGLWMSYDAVRNYKQMRDLLGANYLVDIDQYLVGDDTYGNQLQNDLRHPNRHIHVGDKFGYDYSLRDLNLGADFRVEYLTDRWRIDFGLALSRTSYHRRGFYEKELFPRKASYGKSPQKDFLKSIVKLSAGYSFSPKSHLEWGVMFREEAPDVRHIFYQPRYNNLMVRHPKVERIYATDLTWRKLSRNLTLQVSGFATAWTDGERSWAYYDDASGEYANVACRDLSHVAWGAEFALQWQFHRRWQLSVAGAWMRHTYLRNARLDIVQDVDNKFIEENGVSHLKGYHVGGSPEAVGSVALNYWARKGWGVRLSAGGAFSRYVDPQPVLRSERIVQLASSVPEARDEMTRQTKLKDAFTLDASLMKTFYIRESRLTLMVVLRNITNQTIVYDGYESSRILRNWVNDVAYYAPHPMRYTYAAPRSIYASVSYKF